MLKQAAEIWAKTVYRLYIPVLLIAVIITIFAFGEARNISVSTRLEALMPQGAASVQTLNAALQKTGSFASLQVVVHSESPETTLQFTQQVQSEIDQHDWVETSQYFENIDVIESHKLLLLEMDQLLEMEAEVDAAYPNLIAQAISDEIGTGVTLTLRNENLEGNSKTIIKSRFLDEFANSDNAQPITKHFFTSEDQLTMVLVIWPKNGLDSLSDSKRMVDETNLVLAKLLSNPQKDKLQVGVAGRIANKVAQFDSIVGDLKLGLIGSISLITLLIIFSFRSLIAIPTIFIPLIIGIIWAMGMTSIVVGGLNLITIFLTLILFGLGIDFGIHNFSRYREERRNGSSIEQALIALITQTGAASLIAALTTSTGFFSLMLTDFRAFTEFGFIAGSGVLLIFISMYTVFPALVVLLEKTGIWDTSKPGQHLLKKEKQASKEKKGQQRFILGGAVIMLIFSLVFAPQVAFERDFKNLQAKQPLSLQIANKQVQRVFPDGHDRAIIVVETFEELQALDQYFKELIKSDTETPTIKKISSLLDFIPDQQDQTQRLEVINRLEKRAIALRGLSPGKFQSVGRYLSIEDLNISDLPPTLRRAYVGVDDEPGYLMYVYNSVSMDDSAIAKLFYDDAANVTLNGKTYSSASEAFVFVEMLALMKDDAVKAILLVLLATTLLVFVFIRSITGALIVLTPPILGVLVTVGFMGAFGPKLSIMNMVILPSLIGLSVDNSIHIYHRFKLAGVNANIRQIMNTTGRAAVITTITTLLGFGGMVTASMGGLRSMGLLAIIGFTACLIMTWSLLPVLLEAFGKPKNKKGQAANG
ncbi:MAG: MMPL family transporter [Robiginitomaculum sp.]|nr:MMPL family transporter [Robiginitomaculum sp.]